MYLLFIVTLKVIFGGMYLKILCKNENSPVRKHIILHVKGLLQQDTTSLSWLNQRRWKVFFSWVWRKVPL